MTIFNYSNVRVTAVEIDPIILEVAEQYFDLKQGKRLHVVIDDGLAFIAGCKNEGEIVSTLYYKVLFYFTFFFKEFISLPYYLMLTAKI